MLLECIPNLSTSDPSVVAELARVVARATPGARLLDHSADVDHGRSVFTLAGSPRELGQTVEALAEAAIRSIDLGSAEGVHPRLGALDVVPFVPLGTAPRSLAVEQARETAARLAERFEIPTFLYGDAATHPCRRFLADHRRGGLGALRERMATGRACPDFGPAAPHATAGVILVGARGPLVAFNVILESTDPRVARNIARAVRASSRSGLPGVKALGFELRQRGATQVSLNLTDETGSGRCDTTVLEAFHAIEREAHKRVTTLRGAEIIGLVSTLDLGASPAEAARVLGVPELEDRLLEPRLADLDLG